ncbi:MAG TPA: GIY-YIG nuclease [Planctomycetaceae bacterium]|nr:GIY-YIG nuclease [Planctomycetaceae bacterium]HRF09019.1 GIY-YIG nuclease family protein [Xanthobacteraceae bacterium]
MYFVYLLTNKRNGTLYLGVTNDLVRRVHEHREKTVRGFSARYGADRLVWFEAHEDVTAAIEREKEIKKWKRAWKLALIEKDNTEWIDLYDSVCR